MKNHSLAAAIQSFHLLEIERYESEIKTFRESKERLATARKSREDQLRN